MAIVEVDEKKLSELETNALALQTIANRVLADVADIRKKQAASAKKPKKTAEERRAALIDNILTKKYYRK